MHKQFSKSSKTRFGSRVFWKIINQIRKMSVPIILNVPEVISILSDMVKHFTVNLKLSDIPPFTNYELIALSRTGKSSDYHNP